MARYYSGKKIILGYFNGKKFYDDTEPFKLTATQDSSSIAYRINGTLSGVQIQVSTDKETWSNWDGTAITLNNGNFRYIRNTANTLSVDFLNNFQFVMNGKISASGNIRSMINYAPLSNYCFTNLFSSCSALISAPKLPDKELADGCYVNLFQGCSSLIEAPELPATTLKSYCYYGMFYGCSSLVNAPELPALSLDTYCYAFMFNGCTSLTNAPTLPALTLPQKCYHNMFNGCSSLKINENGSGTRVVAIPPDVVDTSAVAEDMFTNTGGTFTGTPVTGNIYNWYN